MTDSFQQNNEKLDKFDKGLMSTLFSDDAIEK